MIYLDNAATSKVKPPEVIKAVTEAMTQLGNAGRGVNDASLDAARTIFGTRMKLAEFFNAKSPTCVAFTMNSTESLNIAIKGLLSKGDHAITTMLEHNSVLRPLYEMQEKGVELSIVKPNEKGYITTDAIDSYIKPNTKLIVCTHASNLTGNVMDIESIGALAKKNGIFFVVDASQSAGVFPIDVEKMNIDALCFTGHKSLLAPQGTGGLVVREGVEIKPLLSGGTGVQTYNKSQPSEMPTRLEAGTLNGHGIAGLSAAIDYINATGMDAIRKKESDLARMFYDGIKDIENVITYGDYDASQRAPIVTINIGEYDSATVGDILFNDYGINIRSGGHCAPLAHEYLGTVSIGAVRFSFSHNNTVDEVQEVINAVKEISNE